MDHLTLRFAASVGLPTSGVMSLWDSASVNTVVVFARGSMRREAVGEGKSLPDMLRL